MDKSEFYTEHDGDFLSNLQVRLGDLRYDTSFPGWSDKLELYWALAEYVWRMEAPRHDYFLGDESFAYEERQNVIRALEMIGASLHAQLFRKFCATYEPLIASSGGDRIAAGKKFPREQLDDFNSLARGYNQKFDLFQMLRAHCSKSSAFEIMDGDCLY